jgi:hypothetical protein
VLIAVDRGRFHSPTPTTIQEAAEASFPGGRLKARGFGSGNRETHRLRCLRRFAINALTSLFEVRFAAADAAAACTPSPVAHIAVTVTVPANELALSATAE